MTINARAGLEVYLPVWDLLEGRDVSSSSAGSIVHQLRRGTGQV